MSLFCQNCGLEHPSYAEVCPRCGQRQPSPPAAPRVDLALSQTASDDLHGIGGWLLFLCISLTFLVPARQLVIAINAFRNLATSRVSIQALLRLGSVGAIYTGLAIFSCVAGVMLWMENPKGVDVAKAYLLVGAVLPICLFLLLHLAGMHVGLFGVIFGRLVYSVTWFFYLTTSRRVRLTYGTS